MYFIPSVRISYKKGMQTEGFYLELVKKNVHMNGKSSCAFTQFTVDKDENVPDSKPDIGRIIFKQGDIHITEVRPLQDQAAVKGTLAFRVLYVKDQGDRELDSFEGTIPVEEILHMEGVTPESNVEVTGEIDDISVSVIHSRKLNVQAIVSMTACSDEIRDQETTEDVSGGDTLEYRRKQIPIAEICFHRKDVYRVHEEIALPSNLPNVKKILWDCVRLGAVEVKPQDGKLKINGEMNLFVLYEAEGDEGMIQWHETTVPFSGELECRDCKETYISDTRVNCVNREIRLVEDLDGEDRVISAELTLDLLLRLYEEKMIPILSDVYGVTKEVTPQLKKGTFRRLCMRNQGKCRAAGQLSKEQEGVRILQICHSEGAVKAEEIHAVENGVTVNGVLQVQILYITADDRIPYVNVSGSVPFHYVLEAEDIKPEYETDICVSLEQLTTAIASGDEIEVKAVIGVQGTIFEEFEEDIIEDLQISDLNPAKMKELPSMAGYFVTNADTLWQIGKRYYVPVNRIKELNGLTSDEIKEGDKLIIVR